MLKKTMNIGVLIYKAPIEPADFIVLSVGIIVSFLSPKHFVTHEKHRCPDCYKQNTDEVLSLPISQLIDNRIVCWAFDSTVPAEVGIGAVTIFLTIRFIMLLVIRDEVV